MKKIDFPFSKPEENTGFLLWQVTMTWQRRMNRALDEIDLTHTQFVVMAALGWLLQSSTEVSQKDISVHSNADRMMVSKVLSRLQGKGFISRCESREDARSKWVFLTETGTKKLQKALRIVEQADHEFFNDLKDAEGFEKELIRLIGKN